MGDERNTPESTKMIRPTCLSSLSRKCLSPAVVCRYKKRENMGPHEFDVKKLTRDNCWAALKWHGQEYPDRVKLNEKTLTGKDTWVWGFLDKHLGVNLRNEAGKEIRTNQSPRGEKSRYFTEKRD